MELVEVALPTRLVVGPTRTFPLHHSHTSLTRGLEPGEELVIVDADGEYHAAAVTDIAFTLDDTVYVLQTGVRLPEELAIARLESADGVRRGDVDGVVDLIGEMLRRSRRTEET
ncbi:MULTISPECIES: hypothetical protein [Nocardioides]|uniref:Uncharacterized protein n=1 Tax=Nocardioides lianchengensis TaxID=1045774 RepID=A0A1G6XUW6_9ACTN|nr:hypothetical protein [Nocardioides lianchengensis]NYG13420.1 hypothetical protein [Nocardioides lianchengensis]SDD81166.1 hypothetical protein SAMN05421872_11164 [Nocardioides lianchengensis]